MRNKILIYGNINLNIIDGSSVWLISLVKLLSKDQNNIIDILLKTDIISPILTNSLRNLNNVNLINAKYYIKSVNVITEKNLIKVIDKIDDYRDYSCIIIRGFDTVKLFMKSPLIKKVIPYITDYSTNYSIDEIRKKDLIDIYNIVKNMFVQTKEMKVYVEQNLGVDGKKITILSPIVFSNPKSTVFKKPKSIVYAGKFAMGWNILELILIMQKLYDIDPEIKLYVIGDKFNRDIINKKEYILKQFKEAPNIEYLGALSREQTTQIIESCSLGYNYRSSEIDNDNSIELSTKLLEYCHYGLPVIMRKNKMYSNLFGENYPLFADNIDDVVSNIISFFNNDNIKEELLKIAKDVAQSFSTDKIYSTIKPAIYSYEPKKLRLLISGHDLKFIRNLFPLLEKEYDLKIQKNTDYLFLNFKESKKLLKGTDIIWCEWMLFNAEWYSKNKLPHQKLYIRAHRFEITKKYGYKLNLNNVNKIITVSYNYYEMFINKFSFPRYKVTVISNFIETKLLDKPKNDNFKYNIALIGALPSKKGLDEAVELLANIKKNNSRYKLLIAGKSPEQVPFIWNVPEQRAYYQKVYQQIKDYGLINDVIFTGWVDIPEFLQNVGYTLSLTSSVEPESFHIAPMETVSSGGVALVKKWPGVQYIYPKYMIFESISDIINRIEELNKDSKAFDQIVQRGKKFVYKNYDIEKIVRNIQDLISNS